MTDLVPGRKPPNYRNKAAQRYGKLTVICRSEHKAANGGMFWVCRCQCGNYCEVRGDRLESGQTKSCPECARQTRIERLRHYSQLSKEKAQARREFAKAEKEKGAEHGEGTE